MKDSLKGRELRIGNLVLNEEHGVSIVTSLSDFFINLTFFQRNKGIDLTEKWVAQLGVEKMPEKEYTMNTYDLAGFKLWHVRGEFLFNDKIKIQYVHELQNLFYALTKKELDTSAIDYWR